MKNKYTKGDMTIVWEPEKCIHSGSCVKGLPRVFRPSEKPWIQAENSDIETIKMQIDSCPSGALSYYMSKQIKDADKHADYFQVQVLSNGPLVVKGNCMILHKDGTEEIHENRVSLCRCGASSNKPFCDGTHKGMAFDE